MRRDHPETVSGRRVFRGVRRETVNFMSGYGIVLAANELRDDDVHSETRDAAFFGGWAWLNASVMIAC